MIHMLKTLDVVAAIIEQDGKFCWRSARPTPISRECGSSPAAKSNPAKPAQALARELQEELAIDARPECYIASHQREVSARLIHLHAWWVPHFTANPSPAITASCAGVHRRRR
jgi:(d)CTP diphosphatase